MRKWVLRFLLLGVGVFLLAYGAAWLVEIYPRHDSHPPLRLAKGTLAIQHARIYVSPTDPPIEDGTVLVRDGLIAAAGPQLAVPPGARTIPCDHCTITAGFWNTHVHFTEQKWSMAQWKS